MPGSIQAHGAVLPHYIVHRVSCAPSGDWNDPVWAAADWARIGHFHPASSAHRPETLFRLLHDDEALHGVFMVRDRYVRCTHMTYQSAVYKDACIECFFKPFPEKGHMNFEMNCCGTLLLRYVENPTRLPDGGFARQEEAPQELGARTRIQTSLSGPIAEEIVKPVTWRLRFTIPVLVLETYLGPLRPLAGRQWRANFYKCAEENSHPHWAAWAPIGDRLDFHQPDRFGVIFFA